MSQLKQPLSTSLSRWIRPAQILLGGAVIVMAWLSVRRALARPEALAVDWTFRPAPILSALLITWAMYALLISGWRRVLVGWGQRLSWRDAARIWTVSSLGALLPGRVWAIAGMALMAERAGVSAGAATGSAIVMQLLSMSTGAMIGLTLVGTKLIEGITGGLVLVLVLAGSALAASFALTSARMMRRLGRLLRRSDPLPPLAPGALVAGMVINAVAWLGYGTALYWLAEGTIPSLALPWALATGAFALAYLVGYVLLLAPAGIGVREATLAILLTPALGSAPAVALSIASRLATLINQFGAAAPFLLFRSAPRDHT